jgi:hypothetical protein
MFSTGTDAGLRPLGTLQTLGVVESVAVARNRSWSPSREYVLALTDDRLVSIDVEDHDRPILAGSLAVADYSSVSAVGDKAYLGHFTEGEISVVDVGESGALRRFGGLPSRDFAASETHAFVRQSGVNAGLHVYDMTGADGPQDVARVSGIRGNPRGVAAGFLYATDDGPGMSPTVATAYSVWDPERPVEAGRLAGLTGPLTTFAWNRAYMTEGDVARPIDLAGAHMRLGAGRIPIPGNCGGVGASGDRLWTARGELAVFDSADIDDPRPVAKLALVAPAFGIAPSDDTGYVADGYGGLVIVTLRELVAPTATVTPPPATATATPTATSSAPAHRILLPDILVGGHESGRAASLRGSRPAARLPGSKAVRR